jgi:hypothetical protein
MTRVNRSAIWTAIVSLSLAGWFAARTLAQSTPDKTAALPHPPPQIDTLLKGWEGNWTCDSTNAAGAWGPGKPEAKVKATISLQKDMGGFWYRGDYSVVGTKVVPPLQAAFAIGWDTGAKAPIMVRYDNTGTVVMETAPSATPDKQVFVGDAHMLGGKTIRFRDTLIRTGPAEMEHRFEMDLGKGFQLMGTDVCKK